MNGRRQNIDTNFNIFFFFLIKHKFQHFLSHYLGDITTKSDKLIGHDKVQSILNRLTTRIKESEGLNLGTWIHKPRD